jgi:hypothetical protein
VIVCLNTYDLCSTNIHCTKITLEKLENFLAIFGSNVIVWDLAAILGEQLGANMVQ